MDLWDPCRYESELSSSYWMFSQEFLGPGSDGWLVPFLKFSLACENNY